MTAKEYLSRYRRLSAYLDCKIEEVGQLRELATRLSPTAMFDRNGKVSDKVGRTAAKIVDLEAEIEEQINEIIHVRAEIVQTIEQVEDERLKTLLTMRYINGYKWERIAFDMQYSFSNVTYYLHPQALREVEKIIKNNKS